MVEPEVVEARLREGIEGVSKLELKDLTGTKDHYEALIVATGFDGLSLIKRHKLVYAALGELMEGPVHALTFKTYTPTQWSDSGAGS